MTGAPLGAAPPAVKNARLPAKTSRPSTPARFPPGRHASCKVTPRTSLARRLLSGRGPTVVSENGFSAAMIETMFQSSSQTDSQASRGLYAAFAPLRARVTRAEPLAPGDEAEASAFLYERPAQAANLLCLLRDNVLESPHNRGAFYGYRDERGRLEGVALIGHSTLFEARTERALRAFARAAQGRAGFRHACDCDTIFLRRD